MKNLQNAATCQARRLGLECVFENRLFSVLRVDMYIGACSTTMKLVNALPSVSAPPAAVGINVPKQQERQYYDSPQTNPEGSRAFELKLTLVGRVRTIVPYTSSNGTSSTTHKAVDSDDFLSEQISLGSFNGRVEAGTHTYPFSLSLPEDLLPSTEVRRVGF